VIEEAWPLQRQGLVPAGAVKRIADFQAILVSFEPQSKAQEALHDAAMRQFNSFFEYRRTRLYSVNSGIPALLWYTVGVTNDPKRHFPPQRGMPDWRQQRSAFRPALGPG
jgi:hypothetical protein